MKKSQATIPFAWFRMKVDQRWSLLPRGRGACSMYFLTVRGESRIWSLSQSSSAIRSSPQVGFSAAIRSIKRRTSADIGGRPTGLDLQRQKRRNAARCQPKKRASLDKTNRFGGGRRGGFFLALLK